MANSMANSGFTLSVTRILIVTGVPVAHADAVLEAIAGAGGGTIGDYTHCAFAVDGQGRFKPSASASPAFGAREQINSVTETRIETFCDVSQARAVVRAIRAAHPYEEPVIYLIPLLNEDDLPSALDS